MKLTKTGLVDKRTIRAFCRRIAEEFHPDKIILFGSYAYGKPTPDSDVDLMVIMPHEGKGMHKAAEIRSKIDARFALDLLVRRQEDIDWRIKWNDFFLMEIMEKGKVLYESPCSRVA